MARRHDALLPLTHDHHHALRHARRLRLGAEGSAEERREAAKDFGDFFREHSVQHFREEEEVLFPMVVRMDGSPMGGITRVLQEHVQIHALVQELDRQVASGEVSPELVSELGKALHDHVRFEEDELFPAIEELAAESLPSLEFAQRNRTGSG